MAERGLPLLLHGEVTDADIDIFDRNRCSSSVPLHRSCGVFQFKIVMEHITTAEAVQFVQESPANIAATVTVQRLLFKPK